jgi:AraC-like DNA-binding protein
MFKSSMLIPHEKLRNWIKVFWFLEGEGNGNLIGCQKIIPDGCATVFIVLDGEINFSIYKNGKMKRGIYVHPPVMKSYFSYVSDDSYFIDIQLNPSVFYKLFNIAVDELKDTMYTLEDLSIKFDSSFLERIYKCKNNKNRVYNELNDFLIDLFYKSDFNKNESICNINKLYKDGDLDAFFKSQNLSVRQLERNLKKTTGLTPKSLSRIGRFYSILDYIKFREHNTKFKELAKEQNFSNHSHFIREFKSLTAATPESFLNINSEFPQYQGLCNLRQFSKY